MPELPQPFFAARPRISLDGQEENTLSGALLELLVIERNDGYYCCHLAFDWSVPIQRGILDFGRTLEVHIGEALLFEGQIMALGADYPSQAPPQMQVRAEGRLMDLRLTRRTRTFENLRDRDLFEAIAQEHGLGTELDLVGSAARRLPPMNLLLVQVNQSDLAFLRERARLMDAELWVEGDVLHVQVRRERNAGEKCLAYGQGLLAFSVSADLAEQRTSLTAGGWDVNQKEALAHQVMDQVISAELGGEQSGSAIMESAFGLRPDQLAYQVSLNPDENRLLAESAFRRRARRFVTGTGVAQGDACLRVGTRLNLEGLGPLFEGRYQVVAVRHLYDTVAGYRTEFEVERPGISEA